MQTKTPSLNRKSAGFSIIEVAISAAMMLVISLLLVRFWVTTSEAFTLDGNMVTLKQQSERAMETMAERIRRADTPSIVVSGGNTAIDFVDGFDGSNVRYELQPLAPAGPNWGTIVQTVSGTQSVLAGHAESLQFTASGTGLVTAVASFRKGAGRTETRLTTQWSVSARN
jgi:type II secretory pathway pseudopilin PulG